MFISNVNIFIQNNMFVFYKNSEDTVICSYLDKEIKYNILIFPENQMLNSMTWMYSNTWEAHTGATYHSIYSLS